MKKEDAKKKAKRPRSTVQVFKNGSMRFSGPIADQVFRSMAGLPPEELEKPEGER